MVDDRRAPRGAAPARDLASPASRRAQSVAGARASSRCARTPVLPKEAASAYPRAGAASTAWSARDTAEVHAWAELQLSGWLSSRRWQRGGPVAAAATHPVPAVSVGPGRSWRMRHRFAHHPVAAPHRAIRPGPRASGRWPTCPARVVPRALSAPPSSSTCAAMRAKRTTGFQCTAAAPVRLRHGCVRHGKHRVTGTSTEGHGAHCAEQHRQSAEADQLEGFEPRALTQSADSDTSERGGAPQTDGVYEPEYQGNAGHGEGVRCTGAWRVLALC